MAFTPDPETTWSAGFAGALANPGIKIDLSSFIGKFDYNAAVFEYDSTIGVKRDIEINPVSLLGLIGPSKVASRIASLVGNYEVQVSEYTNITLGNNLNLERSRISFNTNREYTTRVKLIVSGILIVMALVDIAVVYAIGYGLKDNDSGAKIMVGVQQGVYSTLLIVLHYLEIFGVEAIPKLLNLAGQLEIILKTLNILAKNNCNVVDILNPLLTANRILNIKNVADKAFIHANAKIDSAAVAIKVANGQAPCWVARAVYGPENPRWVLFRRWLFGNGLVPVVRTPLQRLYMRHGERFARVVDKSPCLRRALRVMMDLILWIDHKTCTGAGHGPCIPAS